MATQQQPQVPTHITQLTNLDPANFTQATDPSIIAQFLGELAADPANCFTIHPRVVAFKSQASKEHYIARQITSNGVAEYQGCDRIQVLKGSLRAGGTIVWMSGSQFHIGDTGSSDLWHAYIVIYCKREVVIIDPEYRGQEERNRRVKDIRGLGLVTELLPYIYKRQQDRVGTAAGWGRPIDRVRIGSTGFGIPGQLKCTEMTGRWLESFVHAGCPMAWFDDWEEVKLK